jgi:hypothetical protein
MACVLCCLASVVRDAHALLLGAGGGAAVGSGRIQRSDEALVGALY